MKRVRGAPCKWWYYLLIIREKQPYCTRGTIEKECWGKRWHSTSLLAQAVGWMKTKEYIEFDERVVNMTLTKKGSIILKTALREMRRHKGWAKTCKMLIDDGKKGLPFVETENKKGS